MCDLFFCRKRWYLTAIHRNVVRKNTQGVNWWPSPFTSTVPLYKLINILPHNTWLPFPDENVSSLAKVNIENAYTKIVAAGVNPFKPPCVIDMYSTPKFSSYQINTCMTLTKTRASGLGYWCSTKGGPLNISEMSLLQGFDPKVFNPSNLGITPCTLAGCIGNAQSFTVVKAVILHCLYMSAQISKHEFDEASHGVIPQ